MRKNLIIKTSTLFCLLLFVLVVSAQQTEGGGLSCKARAFQDSIVIRWAPTDYDTWRLGMSNGYKVYGKKTNALGEEDYYAVSDTIYPRAENTWGSDDPNDVMGLAHALLYNFDQPLYEGPQGAFTQTEDKQNRYGFMLFAADLSLEAAQHMGLSFTDTNIEDGYVYEYYIYILGTDVISFVQVDPANIPPLPQPDSLGIFFGDEEFHLGWQKADLEQYYTYYDIEYSTDGGVTFEKMNERPYVNIDPLDSSLPKDYMFYHDSISNYVDEYQFRVIGHSPFGETGPPSEVVSGKGRPSPLTILPRITEVIGMEDSTFTINWVVNQDYEDSIVGFNLIRYEEYPGVGYALNGETLIDPSTRTFQDMDAFLVNHYQVEAIDVNGYPYRSPSALGQIVDSIPPEQPIGLIGSVDTIIDSVFVVKLEWTPNEEEDLAGYHVFTSNGLGQEFATLTSAGKIMDTVFYDTLPAYTLAENIYYKIRAVDFVGNLSDYSEVVHVLRPDLIAPVPPHLNDDIAKSADGSGMEISWINSPSKDVVSYEVQRKLAYSDESWQTVMTKAKSNTKNDKTIDTAIEEAETVYWYRVIVTDDAGLQSISDTIKLKPALGLKKHKNEIQFELRTEATDKAIELSWNLMPDAAISKILIYRSTNNGALVSLAHVNKDELELDANGKYKYTDELVEEGDAYLYKIQCRYENGELSNVSDKATIYY